MKQFYITFLLIISFGGATIAYCQTSVESTNQKSGSIAAGTVNVTAPTQNVLFGATPSLAITASGTTGLGILGYRGEITYNPNVIVVIGGNGGCNVTGTISSSLAVSCTDNFVNATTRRIDFFAFGTVPISGAGDLIKFNFQVVGSIGSVSPLNFTDFFFNEGGPFDPADVTTNGSVTVPLIGPTAAGATISGRVLTQNGVGLKNAVVTITDSQGVVRRSMSSSLGYYQFDDVPTGANYVVNVASKRFQFTPFVVALNDDITNRDIIADSGE